MAQYWKLRTINNKDHRVHVAERLKALREQLKSEVSDQTDEHDLRLATWNLMHFGGSGASWRNTDAMLYIAEIIDHFDLVAVQEVKTDMTQLEDLVDDYLGDEWDYIVTDSSGDGLGNSERMAFLYRKGKVRFSRLAGEIVLPDGQTIVGAAKLDHVDVFDRHQQFARSPFLVGFQCGWFQFKLCTVHIYFGDDPKKPDDMTEADFDEIKGTYMDLRRAEIAELAKFFKKRQDKERREEKKRLRDKGWDTVPSAANYILLGDFNIVSPEHETMKALLDNGFKVPDNIKDLPTTLGKTVGYYDQIAHRLKDERIEHRVSNAFNFRKSVFRPEDADHYIDVVKDGYVNGKIKKKTRSRDQMRAYFNRYRFKNQMSDHQLLWSSFKVDLAEDYLDTIQEEALTS
ncbi:endonuclease/exonuclease/phosphatase family protein [Hellea balneolensis]|uniref:endonuclease/exonuclease/phosphatase family protein n=1 Tax=Hellea balneolensis TaxID=287478 RepID=UPI00042A7AE5|nr:endonuclease/exonuclease/phosphatase family protein [Hellea balneolensis]